jgi:hypothetical protein
MEQQSVRALLTKLDSDLFFRLLRQIKEKYYNDYTETILIPVKELGYHDINLIGSELEIVVRDFDYLIILKME